MKFLIVFVFGLLSWPVMEYLLHRFLGHVLKLNTEFKKQHTRHHVESDYFASNGLKVLAAIPVSLISFVLVSVISGSGVIGAAYTLGFILMYGVYEWAHWSFHHRAPKTRIGLKLRKHHFTHHFHNSKMNHGVTSRLLDLIFGTCIELPTVKVPKKFMLSWLLGADKFNINEKFSKDFQLK